MGKGEGGRGTGGTGGTGGVAAATDAVKQRLGKLKPRVAIVLGSGLGVLADEVVNPIRIPYNTIPGFPEPGVAGHKGLLVGGTLEEVPVLVQAGRFHLYEGDPAGVAGLPARVFAELGVEILIVTNAAGGVRRTFPGGTLMLIADHINLMWRNPLIGQPQPGEQRFPIMHESYDGELRALARTVAREMGIRLEEGVYVGLLGPSYETPAEVRMLERLGADAVGMSTVPEVLVARSRGMRCLGFSIITNPGAGISGEALSHEEVLAVSERVARQLSVLLKGVLRRMRLA
ncbi:MAG: purine-nucleoside phosphorylase [Gemmatimonadetes bacterium]|nr:MAG: purine-nucleoside phosphorylase [Gemmatimonadota bacterium]